MKILAVSGGIDSVCLLDIFRHQQILVAHFDHQTRPSSQVDLEFVRKLAEFYQKPFVSASAPNQTFLSENSARDLRYQFLFGLAKKYQAPIYTAHHLDDLVESIAINLIRGTGWRGLAAFSHPQIIRPFLEPKYLPEPTVNPWSRQDILRFVATKQLVFRQDPTNQEDYYLRNRLRVQLSTLPNSAKLRLAELNHHQKNLTKEIQSIFGSAFTKSKPYSRSLFRSLPDPVALELLKYLLALHELSLTRPQLQDFLLAIRQFSPGKYFNLPKDRLIKLTKTDFSLD